MLVVSERVERPAIRQRASVAQLDEGIECRPRLVQLVDSVVVADHLALFHVSPALATSEPFDAATGAATAARTS